MTVCQFTRLLDEVENVSSVSRLCFNNLSLFFFPSVKLQLQATSVGEVVIKGVCANRYLAMNRDGRLFGAVSGAFLLTKRKRTFLFHQICPFPSNVQHVKNLKSSSLAPTLWECLPDSPQATLLQQRNIFNLHSCLGQHLFKTSNLDLKESG